MAVKHQILRFHFCPTPKRWRRGQRKCKIHCLRRQRDIGGARLVFLEGIEPYAGKIDSGQARTECSRASEDHIDGRPAKTCLVITGVRKCPHSSPRHTVARQNAEHKMRSNRARLDLQSYSNGYFGEASAAGYANSESRRNNPYQRTARGASPLMTAQLGRL